MERHEYIDTVVKVVKREQKYVWKQHPGVGVTLALTCDPTIVSNPYRTIIEANNHSWLIYLMDATATRKGFANSNVQIRYDYVTAKRKRFFSFNSANRYALDTILTDSLVVASKTGIKLTIEPRILTDIMGINRSHLYGQVGKYSDIWGEK